MVLKAKLMKFVNLGESTLSYVIGTKNLVTVMLLRLKDNIIKDNL